MSVTISLTSPAHGDAFRNRGISNLVFDQDRMSVAGQVTPVAEVAKLEISVVPCYLIEGRMLKRRDTDPSELEVWRSNSNTPPSWLDAIGPMTVVPVDAQGHFAASFLFVDGQNQVTVIATQTDGKQVIAQLRVQKERGRVFPGQLMASEALRAAQNDWHLTASLNTSNPVSGMPASGSDGTIFYGHPY